MKPGTIPDGWTSAPLGELCGRITTGKLDANAMVADGEYPFFTCARESYRINRYAFDTEALLVSGNGANVGYVHYYKGKFNAYQRTYVLSEFTADVHFLKMFLDRNLQDRIRVEVNAGNTPYITMGTLTEMGVVLPNDAAEQRAIATALSDVDGLLGGLDRLIAKKRDLKQAAMQQLLTGQTRLPGFNGEWEVKTFGEVAVPRRERIDPRRACVHDFCIELEHIESGSGQLLGSTSTNAQSSLKSVFNLGDVLFGKLRAYLRKYWRATRHGVCSTEIWVLVPRVDAAMSEFLFQLVQTEAFIDATSNSYGTHMPRSDWNAVQNYKLSMPPLPEQTAIAAVLSDMDAELAALEQRREKTRALKQAMMQELLTGKTRLI